MIRFRPGFAHHDDSQADHNGTTPPLSAELSRALHARIRHSYYDRPEVLRELARRILDDVTDRTTPRK